MGWFDDVLNGVSSLFSGSNAGNLAGDLINIGGRLYSASQLQSANDAAAAARTQGLNQAAGIIVDAYGNALPQYTAGQNAAAGDIAAGQRAGVNVYNQSAQTASGMYQPYVNAGQPALGYYQSVMGANPYNLTPAQAIAYNDASRRSANNLATSGLRGSGRAVAAAQNDLENRTRAGMVQENITRQNDAASKLLGVGTQATGAQARIESDRGRYAAGAEETIGNANARAAENIGTRTADTTLSQGRAQAGAAEGSSVIDANRGTANAELGADALGNVTGTIGGALKSGYSTRPYYNDRTGGSSGQNPLDRIYGTSYASGYTGFKRGGKVPAISAIQAQPQHYAAGGRVKHWVAGAIKRPGQLHRDLGIPAGQRIPEGRLEAAAKQPGKVGQRARLAETMKSWH
jgi:hypothetical protein